MKTKKVIFIAAFLLLVSSITVFGMKVSGIGFFTANNTVERAFLTGANPPATISLDGKTYKVIPGSGYQKIVYGNDPELSAYDNLVKKYRKYDIYYYVRPTANRNTWHWINSEDGGFVRSGYANGMQSPPPTSATYKGLDLTFINGVDGSVISKEPQLDVPNGPIVTTLSKSDKRWYYTSEFIYKATVSIYTYEELHDFNMQAHIEGNPTNIYEGEYCDLKGYATNSDNKRMRYTWIINPNSCIEWDEGNLNNKTFESGEAQNIKIKFLKAGSYSIYMQASILDEFGNTLASKTGKLNVKLLSSNKQSTVNDDLKVDFVKDGVSVSESEPINKIKCRFWFLVYSNDITRFKGDNIVYSYNKNENKLIPFALYSELFNDKGNFNITEKIKNNVTLLNAQRIRNLNFMSGKIKARRLKVIEIVFDDLNVKNSCIKQVEALLDSKTYTYTTGTYNDNKNTYKVLRK